MNSSNEGVSVHFAVRPKVVCFMAVPSESSNPSNASEPGADYIGTGGSSADKSPLIPSTIQRYNSLTIRTEEWRRALAPKMHQSDPLLSERTTTRVALCFAEAGIGQAGWRAFIQILAAQEYISPKLVTCLQQGFVNCARQHGTISDERWEKIANSCVQALYLGCQFSWEHFGKLIPALADLKLEQLPCADREMLSHNISFALRRGQSVDQIIGSFKQFLELSSDMSLEMKQEARELFARRAKHPLHRDDLCFSCFDAAEILLSDPNKLNLNTAHLSRSLDTLRENARNNNVPNCSSVTTRAVLAIVSEVAQYARALNVEPLPLVDAALALLADANTTVKSLEPLTEFALPYYKFHNKPIDSLLRNFRPIPSFCEATSTQHECLRASCSSGHSPEPFMGNAFKLLALLPENRPALELYCQALLSHPNRHLAPLLGSPNINWITQEVAAAAATALKNFTNKEQAVLLIQDYISLVGELEKRSPDNTQINSSVLSLPNTILAEFAVLGIHSEALHQLVLYVSKHPELELSTIMALLRNVELQAIAWSYLEGGSVSRQEYKRGILVPGYKFDQVPFAMPSADKIHIRAEHDPRALKMDQEVAELILAARTISSGFGSYTLEARHIPGSQEESLLVQFARSASKQVWLLRSSAADLFPGSGVSFSGLMPECLFAQDPLVPDDPFHLYRSAWPFAKNELPTLANVTYSFLRGMIVISGKAESSQINGIAYSLVILNDHFHNHEAHTAYLIPTQILEQRLDRCRITDSQSAIPTDDAGLTIQELLQACNEQNLPALNLTWPSNLAGLCNSFPANSAPYFSWETRVISPIFKDRAGHAHKGTLLGGYQSIHNLQLEAALIPFRELHNSVYSVSTHLFNYYYLFRCGLAAFHKGESRDIRDENRTFSGGLPNPENLEAEKIKFREVDETSEMGIYIPPKDEVNPHAYRMLEASYAWHSAVREGRVESSEAPVFLVTPLLEEWPAASPILLDTRDLSLHIGDSVISLPAHSDGTGEEERRAWSEWVVPYLQADRDIRPLPRNYVRNYSV